MSTSNKEALGQWLTLRLTPQLGVKTLQKLIDHHNISPHELVTLNPSALTRLKLNDQQIKAITQPNWPLIEQLSAWVEPADQHILCYFDCEPSFASSLTSALPHCLPYPEYLKNISSPPLLLFVKGDHTLLHQPQLAMVGSRNLTITGQDNARNFAHNIAELDIVVTSGLAVGVDGYCHRGALDANGKTIAVLGTGLNQIYPKRHLPLAHEIVARHGALVSEFLPEQTARPENFPRRNRIIAGLSQGTLVVEAAVKSGSLITARYAMEQGREVFAIPGSIHNPMSKGCHALIKQGAKLVESIFDIIEDMPLFQQHIASRVNPAAPEPTTHANQTNLPHQSTESAILQYIGYDTTSVDIIAQRSAQSINEILTQLLSLEMQGDIAVVAGGYVRLAK